VGRGLKKARSRGIFHHPKEHRIRESGNRPEGGSAAARRRPILQKLLLAIQPKQEKERPKRAHSGEKTNAVAGEDDQPQKIRPPNLTLCPHIENPSVIRAGHFPTLGSEVVHLSTRKERGFQPVFKEKRV